MGNSAMDRRSLVLRLESSQVLLTQRHSDRLFILVRTFEHQDSTMLGIRGKSR